MSLNIVLPMPPSVNAIWRAKRGRTGKPSFFLDARYKAWKRQADGYCLAGQWRGRAISGPFSVRVVLDQQKRRGDCDNRLKAVLDFLHRAGLTDDDSACTSAEISWGDAPAGACLVTVSAAAEKRRTG